MIKIFLNRQLADLDHFVLTTYLSKSFPLYNLLIKISDQDHFISTTFWSNAYHLETLLIKIIASQQPTDQNHSFWTIWWSKSFQLNMPYSGQLRHLHTWPQSKMVPHLCIVYIQALDNPVVLVNPRYIKT